MIPSLDGPAQQFLADMDRLQSDTQRSQRQLSSGLRVEAPSDDPAAYAEAVRLKAEISRNTQVQTNLGTAQAEADTADAVLQNAMTALDQAITAGSQGAGTLATSDQRVILAGQVGSILQQLVGISNTSVSGRYIFSGDQDQVAPYALDSSAGYVRQVTAGSTRQVLDASGLPIAFSRTAQEIFDARDSDGNPGAGNVFAAVQSLKTALENNDSPAIVSALEGLHQAHDHLGLQLSFYGQAQDHIGGALDLAKKFGIQEKAQLSGVQDADAVAATLNLQQAQLHQQAAFQSRAQSVQRSLFDYLG